jgi:hypothetical protein
MSRPHSRRRPLTFRPQLEELEGRLVPNASRVIDAAGNLQLFVVRNDGSLTHSNKEGATVWFSSGVYWAQTYLDPSGQFGVNVLFQNQGRWVAYDAAGSHDMGSGSIRSVSTAFDPAGQKILDVVWDGVGWVQYDNAGSHLKEADINGGPNNDMRTIDMASTAIDRAGGRVSDFVSDSSFNFGGVFYSSSTIGAWGEYNPAGSHGSGGETVLTSSTGRTVTGDAVAWVMPSFDATGSLVYDILHNGEWDYYDAQGAHFMGTGVR